MLLEHVVAAGLCGGKQRGKYGKTTFQEMSKKIFLLQHKCRHSVSSDTQFVSEHLYIVTLLLLPPPPGHLHGRACEAEEGKKMSDGTTGQNKLPSSGQIKATLHSNRH